MIKKYSNCIILAGMLSIISACQQQADETPKVGANKFSDEVIVSIYEAQDHRDTKTLIGFFNDENPAYRQEAAEAFGSVQDSAAIPQLSLLLDDKSAGVRKAAAYALGQTNDSSAVEMLLLALSEEDTAIVRREMIEALGKVVPMTHLIKLQNLLAEDEIEKEGLAWGLYRAGLRNVHDQLSVDIATGLLYKTNSYQTRLGAAHFLSRSRNIDLKGKESAIIEAALYDPSEFVRMAAALALRNATTPISMEALTESIVMDQDYRVRISALRALGNFEYSQVKNSFYTALKDENVNVAITAVGIIQSNAQEDDAESITQSIADLGNTRVKTILLGSLLNVSADQDAIVDNVKTMYEQSEDPYFKAGLLSALAEAPIAYEFVVTNTFGAEHPAISTAGISALVTMRMSEDFPQELATAFADVFKQAIATADIAMVSVVSSLLIDPDFNFKEVYNDYSFLGDAKAKLSLPKDNEALQILNKAIAYFEGAEELPETKNAYNHPIDWEKVKTLENNQKVVVKTDKGDVTLRLLVHDAPGSVINFVKLAEQGYFNGKNFHRVVPNFVIQGGCNRGDGYGGEDYSIRSELANLNYREGSVGMASAGKDTEGTQWFITHSPTPHLDGRYTIFAQVSDGIEVVHNIEVGDKINAVELLK